MKRVSTVSSLKTQFLVDIGLASTNVSCVLLDPFSQRVLHNDTMLMANGLRDGDVLQIHRTVNMVNFYQPIPIALSQYTPEIWIQQIAVPRADRYSNVSSPYFPLLETIPNLPGSSQSMGCTI